MALNLQINLADGTRGVAVNQAGTYITVTDNTGAYDSENNVGGYGSPNSELQYLALLMYAVRVPNSGSNTQCTYSSTQIVYDNGASNDKKTTWTLGYVSDGRYQFSIVALPTSTDQSTKQGGGSLSTDEYYYYTIDSSVYIKTSGGSTKITDYTALLADSAGTDYVTQEWLGMAKLCTYWGNVKYPKYQYERDNDQPYQIDDKEDCIILQADITGADYQFNSGQYTQAEDIVSDLYARFGLS